jgi:hypothetical protein
VVNRSQKDINDNITVREGISKESVSLFKPPSPLTDSLPGLLPDSPAIPLHAREVWNHNPDHETQSNFDAAH